MRRAGIGAVQVCGASLCCAFLVGCATPADQPPGVPRNIRFQVQAVYPSSYDVTVIGNRDVPADELQAAFQLKAVQLAAGRKFTTTVSGARGTESITSVYTGYATIPIVAVNRSLSGTVTIVR